MLVKVPGTVTFFKILLFEGRWVLSSAHQATWSIRVNVVTKYIKTKVLDLSNNSNIFRKVRDLVQGDCISFEFFANDIA